MPAETEGVPERAHWEGQLPRHLLKRSRQKGEPMWTPTQFVDQFEVVTKLDNEGLLWVTRLSDGVQGTIRQDPTGWYYAWEPDYSTGGRR